MQDAMCKTRPLKVNVEKKKRHCKNAKRDILHSIKIDNGVGSRNHAPGEIKIRSRIAEEAAEIKRVVTEIAGESGRGGESL